MLYVESDGNVGGGCAFGYRGSAWAVALGAKEASSRNARGIA